MLRKLTFGLIASLFFFQCLNAQERWSLAKCIEHARQNSLTIKQAQYQISSAELNLTQNRLNRLPNLNGNINGGLQLGRSIDPTTDQFVQQNFGANSVSVSSSIILYGGNRINNSIEQSKYDLEAARLEAQAASYDIALQVAGGYLNILLSEEQLENARKRMELSESQLEQTDKLINAGTLPQNDRLDILAQIALDRQAIIEAQNLVDLNYLSLKQLLELDPNVGLLIEKPNFGDIPVRDPAKFNLNEIYTAAMKTQPIIEANEMRLRSLEIGEEVAKAFLLPTVSLSASLSSNYSTVARDFTRVDTLDFALVKTPAQPVEIDGEPADIAFFQPDVDLSIPKRQYFDQLNDNFGQSVGVNIRIPIFNNYQNKVGVEQARLNTLNQQVINQQQKQNLKSDVQRAIADARAAKNTLDAAQFSLEAAQAAFDNSIRRFELGAINTFDLTSARNRLDQAQVELTRAKYQYIFNLKVVDFYMGNPLELN